MSRIIGRAMTEQDPRLQGLAQLVAIVDRLRAPDGCPWDREQTLASMVPHVLEEAYEVADALRSGESADIAGELGDLLMNVCLVARIAQDDGRFSLADVTALVNDKLVRRHPHVFGEEKARDGAEALRRWEAIKRQERTGEADRSALAGVPRDLPGLLRAVRVGSKAAQVGFDWPDRSGPLAKVDEELAELRSELAAEPVDRERAAAELGDLLFAVVNLARHLQIDPESALRGTIDRFCRRFRAIEEALGDRMGKASLDEMEALWRAAK
jgi:MazG family protein